MCVTPCAGAEEQLRRSGAARVQVAAGIDALWRASELVEVDCAACVRPPLGVVVVGGRWQWLAIALANCPAAGPTATSTAGDSRWSRLPTTAGQQAHHHCSHKTGRGSASAHGRDRSCDEHAGRPWMAPRMWGVPTCHTQRTSHHSQERVFGAEGGWRRRRSAAHRTERAVARLRSSWVRPGAAGAATSSSCRPGQCNRRNPRPSPRPHQAALHTHVCQARCQCATCATAHAMVHRAHCTQVQAPARRRGKHTAKRSQAQQPGRPAAKLRMHILGKA